MWDNKQGEWKQVGGAAVSVLPWSEVFAYGDSCCDGTQRDTSDLCKYSQANNTCCALTSMLLALQHLTQCPSQGQCCSKQHTHTVDFTSDYTLLTCEKELKRMLNV